MNKIYAYGCPYPTHDTIIAT